MKKPNMIETILFLILGLLPLVGYFLLMTEFFKVDPLKGIT